MSNPKPRAMAVGVVYDADGNPKLDPDFMINLDTMSLALVRADLDRHGFKLNDDLSVERK